MNLSDLDWRKDRVETVREQTAELVTVFGEERRAAELLRDVEEGWVLDGYPKDDAEALRSEPRAAEGKVVRTPGEGYAAYLDRVTEKGRERCSRRWYG